MVHYRGGRAAVDEAVYPEMDEFWDDLTSAYAEEVRRLGELGCTYLQFDDTSLAYLNDPKQREMIASQGGGDVEHLHEAYISHINEALAGKPEGMAVTTHMCRGNFRSSWVAEGGYDFVAEALFGELGVDGFFMEWDDARSGGFEPLRFVPKGKTVVLGLVTTKRGELESKDELKRRIEEASQYVDVDQLCLSPQCGFSSTLGGQRPHRTTSRSAKLRLIVETAEEVWGVLSDVPRIVRAGRRDARRSRPPHAVRAAGERQLQARRPLRARLRRALRVGAPRGRRGRARPTRYAQVDARARRRDRAPGPGLHEHADRAHPRGQGAHAAAARRRRDGARPRRQPDDRRRRHVARSLGAAVERGARRRDRRRATSSARRRAPSASGSRSLLELPIDLQEELGERRAAEPPGPLQRAAHAAGARRRRGGGGPDRAQRAAR